MEENKPKSPLQEHTKDDSSDVEKVRKDKQSPPPPSQAQTGKQQRNEDEEAEKGHS
ncbi:MAG: hypothetical protein LPK07_01930 [Hymenobacteraceae bacterium]|nr:hypothetical protein [Hymenobacteraceae bacterium]MDX5480421.1 hypothetical protein [Hymenobacteraceae bacterium]